MDIKPTYYAVIPANVRYDKDLTPNAKLLYAEITVLTQANGICWASDNYFMELYGVERRTVQNWLKQLEDNGYIKREVIYKKNSKEIEKRYINLLNINAQGYGKYVHEGMENMCAVNNTSNNTTSNNISNMNNSIYEHSSSFDTFWKQYPKKRNKGQAERAFKRMVKDKETLDLILEDLERRKNFEDWIKSDGQFIPYPSTYLNAQGWLDEYEVVQEKITKEIGEYT